MAIPVFSLRSEKSLGVGEFRDLHLMADWAKKTGLRLVQVLPVNDTTVNYTWTDSYPYSAITVFALHPMFLALDAIPGAEKIIGKKALADARKRLNQSPVVDYDEVINLKKSWGRKIYDAQASTFLKSPEFQTFFEENKYWLEPYAVFCYLRDTFRTADFTQWKEHAVYHPDLLAGLASPDTPAYPEVAFFYFQQFYLDQQLRQATQYAREQGIVLKGDLPIGIYRHSVDAWVAPRLYNMDGQAGAPPDPFSENGQNWGFPTYKWEEMAKDNYQWWRDRMTYLSRYFDAYRIDHILGFFRIWEIPISQVEGLMGRFRPAIPVTLEEFQSRGIPFDEERFCQPFITQMLLEEWFEEDADWVRQTFLSETAFQQYAFKPEFDCQRKVEAFFEDPAVADRKVLEKHIYRLFAEALFFPEPESDGAKFHPRIDFQSTHSFRVLPHDLQDRLSALHHDYFYSRQEAFWRKEAMEKLPALKKATEMLICGEDLGMVPACVPGVMREMGILSLEIQRMSKNPSTEFLQEQDIPYLSVTSSSTHDMSTIRGWWEESDRDQIRRFFYQELGMLGEPPLQCDPFVAQAIIRQHLEWPNMWTVFPLQDLLAMDGKLRWENPFDERINVPANPKHYWRYRMHLTLEELLGAEEFNAYVLEAMERSGRTG
ncbi:MAG: 4-alpha-glucanotransferase [Haliscomenobacter sp.]|nr:4-alpha-glucanotransferase [Haliscomenobacter sp.]